MYSHRSGRAVLWVLLALFLVLVVAVIWTWRRPDTQPNVEEGRQVSETFLAQLQRGHAETAWESTTAEFKSAQGREKFVEMARAHAFFKKPLSFVSVNTVTLHGQPRAEYFYRTADGQKSVRLLAGQEGGQWRVDRLAIE